MSSLDPQSQAVLDALNGAGILPFRQFTPAVVREKVLKLRAARPASQVPDGLVVTEEMVGGPDGPFRVRIVRPMDAGAHTARPAVIYFHGGGFVFGGLDETDELVRTIAARTGAVVFNVDYHLAPETKFPVAVNEAFAALAWVAGDAARLGVDPANIVLAGDSAGGNLTIVAALMARERGGPRIKYHVPIYPSLDLRRRPHYASRLKWGAGGYLLDNDDIEWMLDHYLPRRDEAGDWRASPIVAPSYAGLPPALVITASHDPLADEGKLYAERLAADGVAVEHACFAGTFHGFVGYASVLDVGASAVSLVCDRIKTAVTPRAG